MIFIIYAIFLNNYNQSINFQYCDITGGQQINTINDQLHINDSQRLTIVSSSDVINGKCIYRIPNTTNIELFFFKSIFDQEYYGMTNSPYYRSAIDIECGYPLYSINSLFK